MKLEAESVFAEETLSTPILVSLFRAIAWLSALATLLVVLSAFKGGDALLSIPMALVVAGSGAVLTMIFFGVAQLLMSIARIEFYATREKNEAILHTLHKIEGHLAVLHDREWQEGIGAPLRA